MIEQKTPKQYWKSYFGYFCKKVPAFSYIIAAIPNTSLISLFCCLAATEMSLLRAVLSPCKQGKGLVMYLLGSLSLLSRKKGQYPG